MTALVRVYAVPATITDGSRSRRPHGCGVDDAELGSLSLMTVLSMAAIPLLPSPHTSPRSPRKAKGTATSPARWAPANAKNVALNPKLAYRAPPAAGPTINVRPANAYRGSGKVVCGCMYVLNELNELNK